MILCTIKLDGTWNGLDAEIQFTPTAVPAHSYGNMLFLIVIYSINVCSTAETIHPLIFLEKK